MEKLNIYNPSCPTVGFTLSALRISLLLMVLMVIPGSFAGASPLNEMDSSDTTSVNEVITLKAYGSALEYDQTEITAEAGSTVTVRLDNTESTMPHNIVLVREESDVREVGIAGMRAHGNDYIPQDEYDRIIAYTSMAGPGDVVEFTIEVPPAGEYPFVCTYPGHFQTMQGTLISVEGE